eukprot:TRINITY_DN37060_c0_g2_i1.p1 TRINITY_DN37060_c0_g2~~TRINITY_DN37060_c0_g2_i1.p1  ORF type:complete len:620 (+),score=169.62 TRINITY_DN37060_c0_g2_i1:70-1929(+)
MGADSADDDASSGEDSCAGDVKAKKGAGKQPAGRQADDLALLTGASSGKASDTGKKTAAKKPSQKKDAGAPTKPLPPMPPAALPAQQPAPPAPQQKLQQAPPAGKAVEKQPQTSGISTSGGSNMGPCFTPNDSEDEAASKTSSRSSDFAAALLQGLENDDTSPSSRKDSVGAKQRRSPAPTEVNPATVETKVESKSNQQPSAPSSQVVGQRPESRSVAKPAADQAPSKAPAMSLVDMMASAVQHVEKEETAVKPGTKLGKPDFESEREKKQERPPASVAPAAGGGASLLDLMSSAVQSVEAEQRGESDCQEGGGGTLVSGTLSAGHLDENTSRSGCKGSSRGPTPACNSPARTKQSGAVGDGMLEPGAAIAHHEVQRWLLTLELDPAILQAVAADVVQKGCCLGGRLQKKAEVRGLAKGLERDKDVVLVLNSTPFQFQEALHGRILRTLFDVLVPTQRSLPLPELGKHWRAMGFEGNDPVEELNISGGLLNLLHLFYFQATEAALFKQLFQLSQERLTWFPFVHVSTLITGLVTESLLAGKLSKLCNASEVGVFYTLNTLYAAVFVKFCDVLRRARQKGSQKSFAAEKAVFLKELRSALDARPQRLLTDFAAKCSTSKP